MKRRLFSILAVLAPLLALPGLTVSSASAATWACTANAYQACTLGDDPGWDEYNNPWNNPAMPPNSYTLYANSHSDWQVVANQAACPTRNCAVEAYDSAQYNYENKPGTKTIADIKHMRSYFRETMPTGNLATNGFDAEAAYDIWLNNYGLEVMIWVDNQGQTPAGQGLGTVKIDGQQFVVFNGGSTYSFVLGQNETSGQIDIAAILNWLVSNHYVDASSYLTQFNFGFEICSTAGKDETFTVNKLTLQQAFN